MAINLKQKKGQTPIQENYNKSLSSYPTSFSGEGYDTTGRNYSPAWGGSFQIGGSLPGATGFMYARHGAPSNGPYAKKTKASAQSGASMQYYQNGLDYLPKSMKKGGPIEDPRGQWAHPGKVTKIPSNNITMSNVPYPVLGISNTGHTQMMYPEQDYKFLGNSVTEYPMMETGGSIQDKGQLQLLDDLTNFTNYNNMKKAQVGARMQATNPQVHMQQYKPIDIDAFMEPKQQTQQAAPSSGGGFDLGSIMKLAGGSGGGEAGGAEGVAELAALAKYGGNFSNKKGKLDVKKLTKVLARNGYEIKKAQKGINLFDSSNSDSQIGAWGNTDTTISAPEGAQTYATGSQADPNAGIMKTTNVPNQFSVSTTPDKLSFLDQASSLFGKADKALGPVGGIGGALNTATSLVGDINQIGADKKNAKKEHGVTRAVIAAMNSKPMVQNAQYVRPENATFEPGQLNAPQGAGTNYLAANGTRVPGNPSEIQNTFSPNNIYTDSGYEPLQDSDNIKKFQYGGGQQLGKDIGGTAGQIGGTILGGPIGGMVGKVAGEFLGGTVANLFGANKLNEQYKKDQEDLKSANFSNQIGGLQGQNAAFMANGGWMNPEYNSQIITKFDGHDVKSTFMHQMRSGGHLSQEYVEPHESSYMQAGGELQTHWGGKAEPISYNPYLPDGGETVMFKGASHKDGGIGVTYGNNPVEVQGGEPATKLQDGGSGGNNLVVFGGMKISPLAAKEIGDEKAIGKKYQTYATEISKNEAKASKTLEDASALIDKHTSSDPFSQLAFSSGQAKMIGAQMQLKNAAAKKQAAGIVQNAILDTADEHGLVADKLAENKIVPMSKKDMKAKWGKAIAKAQVGVTLPPEQRVDNNGDVSVYDKTSGQYIPLDEYNQLQQGKFSFKPYEIPTSSQQTPKSSSTQPTSSQSQLDKQEYEKLISLRDKAEKTKSKADILTFQQEYHKALPQKALEFIQTDKNVTSYGQKKYGKKDIKDLTDEQKLGSNEDGAWGKRTKQYIATLDNLKPQDIPEIKPKETPKFPVKKDEVTPVATESIPTKGPGLERYLPLLNPLFRHKYSANLDPDQLMGERYALLSNQVDPVKAQGYQPVLQTPYDISYQDQLNANQADFNAMQRQLGNNPAALASLAAQKYGANEKVLGEQFRQNQAEKAKVYGENRQTLNDAQLKNLGIYDQQYTRQEQAKSNSRAQAINALTSIGDKIAQSKRDANSMNMYAALNPNFYVDSNGVFHNQGFASLNMEGTGQLGGLQQILKDEAEYKANKKAMSKDEKSLPVKPAAGLKYGGSVNKKETSRNSNIVKAIKNTKLYK